MKLVSGNRSAGAAPAAAPRLYFVHIPKTAGVTLKAFLENHYTAGEAFIMDEWKARNMAPEVLEPYRLFTGHYSSEVFNALGGRPDLVITMVREPVGRFRSWTAHGRRSSYWKYKQTCTQGTDIEVARADDSYAGRQAHWLRRAFHEDGEWKGIPSAGELPALLDQVDIPGMAEEIERFMQLVAFRMGWSAPDLGWHLNRRPDPETASSPDEDAELREALAVDVELYAQVSARFWRQYAEMLSTIDPGSKPYTAQTAQSIPIELVNIWLREWHIVQLRQRLSTAQDRLEFSADQPIVGDGWWWRERPGPETAYRWSGPGSCSTMTGAPLVADRYYALNIEVRGAADWITWEQVEVAVNGQPLRIVHERRSTSDTGFAKCRLYAQIEPSTIARQDGLTQIVFTIPEPKQSLANVRREESQDTFNNDLRKIGVAIHRVTIEPIATPLKATLSLRRPQAA